MAEKYTQWADKSCGVNPFVPGEIALPKQTLSRFGRYVMAALVALPRLTLAACLVSLYLVIQLVLNEFLLLLVSLGLSWLSKTEQFDPSYFVPLAVVAFICGLSILPIPQVAIIPSFRRIVQRFILSGIPPILGVSFSPLWANSARVVGVKVNAEEKAKNEKSSPFASLMGGDVVISNLTNVLEIIFYESVCSRSPLYVLPIPVTGASSAPVSASNYQVLCHATTFTKALQFALTYTPFSQRNHSTAAITTGRPLAVIVAEAKKKNRPVFLFVEGVRTNGAGVLEFNSQVFYQIAIDIKLHLSGFIYSTPTAGVISPPCPAGSPAYRLFWQSATVGAPTSVVVNCLLDRYGVPKLALPGKTKASVSTTTSSADEVISEKRIDAWTQELREVFSKVINKKMLKLSMIDYDSFYEYYAANISGNTSVSKKISDARGGKK